MSVGPSTAKAILGVAGGIQLLMAIAIAMCLSVAFMTSGIDDEYATEHLWSAATVAAGLLLTLPVSVWAFSRLGRRPPA